MNTRPIPAEILERRGNRVSRDTDGSLIFGFSAVNAASAVEYGPQALARAFMQGDLEEARGVAQRIAVARDALPTEAERDAIPYRERLIRTIGA